MQKIKNSEKLATTQLRQHALQIAKDGLAAIDTQAVIKQTVSIEGQTLRVGPLKFELDNRRILLAGVGKCAGEAAIALENILGDKLTAGIILDIAPTKGFSKTKPLIGSHPMPSAKSVAAAQEIVAFLKQTTSEDLVIVVISGGGSTLLCLPPDGFSCLDEKNLLEALFRSGATIQEINILRKHLSSARGGGLAKAAYPSQVVGLIFSDVPSNQLEFVASGPTVKDSTTIADAQQVLKRYNLNAPKLLETPKADKYFEAVYNHLTVSNQTALAAMEKSALKLGYQTTIETTELSGEARLVGRQIGGQIHTSQPTSCRLFGGETTVTVNGSGHGGRNQELAIAAADEIGQGELVLALASDGIDNSDYAGALVDSSTKDRATKLGLDPSQFLKNNDSYSFFSVVGDYLDTGRTGA